MKKIMLEEKYALEYIKYSLLTCMKDSVEILDFKYHHNTAYSNVTSILKHGILSMKSLSDSGIVYYSDKILKNMSNIDSHVNGIDGISLCITGLTDLGVNEDEWDPYNEHYVDFLIDDVDAYRSCINYGNEFITSKSISKDNIKSIDIRLLKYLKSIFDKKTFYSNDQAINILINRYNYLNEISKILLSENLSIPLRENSSNNNRILDINKISKFPKVKLK